MKVGEAIDKLNDIYGEDGDYKILVEDLPGQYRELKFISVIHNDKDVKFVVFA